MTDITDTEKETATAIGTVVAVCRNAEPGLPKPVVEAIELVADHGVEGDYHAGKFVRHRYLARKDPTRPNLRQVCLVDASVFPYLAVQEIHIGPGMMGENITVTGLALMQLPTGTRLTIGSAEVELTEIRNPCLQLNGIDPRLLKAVVVKENGNRRFLAGYMARILRGGAVKAGDRIKQTHSSGQA
jgi:MOSC domain-containing protein YiiM